MADMPLAAEKGKRIGYLLLSIVGTAATAWYAVSEMGRSSYGWVLLVMPMVMLALTVFYLGGLLARLHIAPEGIAITLFGLTLRRLPAERIHLLAGVRGYHNKADHQDVIAVCADSLEELTVLERQHTPKLLQNGVDRWYGETAAKYLYRRATAVRGSLNLNKRILWLDWSAERLNLLREMYPQAQWLDGTEKKLFDAQLTK